MIYWNWFLDPSPHLRCLVSMQFRWTGIFTCNTRVHISTNVASMIFSNNSHLFTAGQHTRQIASSLDACFSHF